MKFTRGAPKGVVQDFIFNAGGAKPDVEPRNLQKL